MKSNKNTIKALAIINAAIFGVIALILLNDAFLRALVAGLVADYVIPSGIVLGIGVLFFTIVRNSNKNDDKDEERSFDNTWMSLKVDRNFFGFWGDD
jgi:hypothetical protein